jgi:formylglycine-generating enzyme required for sulfatase activity
MHALGLGRLVGVVVALATAAVATAGPWSQLPDAVTRLQRSPDDREAMSVVVQAEQSVLGEASSGHLAAAAALLDAYSSLIAPLGDAEQRTGALQRRLARTLVEFGDGQLAEAPRVAGTAWGLAASYGAGTAATDRLRTLLLPPADAEPGELWTAAVDGAELAWQPPFRFAMGCTLGDGECRDDELYLRWVELPGLWIDRTEVTNEMYRRCVAAGACTVPSESTAFEADDRGDEPVAGVTWRQARVYARWAGRRLPSESEWERGARGKRIDWRFPWGKSKNRSRANVYGEGGGTDVFNAPAPVRSFYANGWRLYDMAGNVWEWCEDSYHANLIKGPRGGEAWIEGGQGRVLRGGSWRRTMELARVSSRDWQEEEYSADDVGFRCVASAGRSVDAQGLAAMATRMFPVREAPGEELARARLEASDRRYLQRRSVTWLALEGRAWEALSVVMALLERDARDPVAGDLLNRLEDELVADASAARISEVERKLGRYRTAVGRSGRFNDRVVATERKVLAALKAAGGERQRRGDAAAATACYRAALGLSPGDPALKELLRTSLPAPGESRVWPGDQREMVWIPSGKFMMGRAPGDDQAGADENPGHMVWVNGFWLDSAEVTNAEYRRCVAAGVCTPPANPVFYDDPRLADHPVLWVDWHQARSYARWAGKRLPTETEWELAARTGQRSRYPWGKYWRDGAGNAFGVNPPDYWSGSSPVGSFAANEWGVFDLYGNAWEWVEDVYHPSYRGAPRDGRAWLQVTGGGARPDRVLRGGSYVNFPPKLRVSQRDHRAPASASKTSGFRCAVDAD